MSLPTLVLAALDKATPTAIGNWVAHLTPAEILALAANGAATDADLGWARDEDEIGSNLKRHIYFDPSPAQLDYLNRVRT